MNGYAFKGSNSFIFVVAFLINWGRIVKVINCYHRSRLRLVKTSSSRCANKKSGTLSPFQNMKVSPFTLSLKKELTLFTQTCLSEYSEAEEGLCRSIERVLYIYTWLQWYRFENIRSNDVIYFNLHSPSVSALWQSFCAKIWNHWHCEIKTAHLIREKLCSWNSYCKSVYKTILLCYRPYTTTCTHRFYNKTYTFLLSTVHLLCKIIRGIKQKHCYHCMFGILITTVQRMFYVYSMNINLQILKASPGRAGFEIVGRKTLRIGLN